MASLVDYSYSSDGSESESEYSGKPNCLDLSYVGLDSGSLAQTLDAIATDSTNSEHKNKADYYKCLMLKNNQLSWLPDSVAFFRNLRCLDVSANGLGYLPDSILHLQQLTSLIVKNNHITDAGLPKDLGSMQSLKEINLSGNCLTRFATQFLEIEGLKFLYIGGNRITEIPREIMRLQKLHVLYLGGNCLTEIPAEVGLLKQLQALILCDNALESLPSTIVQLKKLRSLLLHNNRLTTLPPQIVTLQELMELSLRGNPLVVRFVRDLTYNPPTLLELAGRVIKSKSIPINPCEVPHHLVAYLSSAHQCVNPKCQGVYFDSRVEHVKFVDFCGRYRIPLLQYLCSPQCSKQPLSSSETSDSDSDNDYRLRKVLLG